MFVFAWHLPKEGNVGGNPNTILGSSNIRKLLVCWAGCLTPSCIFVFTETSSVGFSQKRLEEMSTDRALKGLRKNEEMGAIWARLHRDSCLSSEADTCCPSVVTVQASARLHPSERNADTQTYSSSKGFHFLHVKSSLPGPKG